jgi:hypothetical protein
MGNRRDTGALIDLLDDLAFTGIWTGEVNVVGSGDILHGFPDFSVTGVCPTCHKVDDFVNFVAYVRPILPDNQLGAYGVCHEHRVYWNAGFKFPDRPRGGLIARMVRERMTLIRSTYDRVQPYY